MTPMQGEFAALMTAGCWTVSALSFESASRRIGSLAVNMLRLFIALAFLSAYGYLVRGAALPLDASGHMWFWLTLSGLAGFTLGDMCLFRSFIVIGSRTTMLMMSLVPVLTALMSRAALGESMVGRHWLGLFLTVGGVALVVSEKRRDENGEAKPLPLSGILLAVGAAMGQASGLVLSKHGMRDYDPFAATQIRVIAGIAGFSLIFFLSGWWPKVLEGLRNGAAMARLSLGAFFGPFLGVSLSLAAVQSAKTGVAAALMSITPILIIPPSIILFKEKITWRAVAGAAVAVIGVGILLYQV